ncbi:MAG: putrescine aminotransferase [Armatimonadetes bacterium]|nr:putrescine aminotransferase [Armatimonadota bacterium]
MKTSREEILREAEEALRIIEAETLSPEEQERLIRSTVEGFRDYVNPGFLDYRKSVSTDYTAVEWSDRGNRITDVRGKEYLDCLGGFGVYNVGHRNPKVLQAVLNQLKRQAIHSQELLDPLRAKLARLVSLITPGALQYAFFCNSGTEAVEGALKLARLHTKKKGYVATTRAFHGKSMGSLSATAKAHFRTPYLPLVPGFHHVPYGDARSVEAILSGSSFVGDDVAAVIVEPIQGEGGVNVPPDDYLPALREMCTRYGAMLIVDEVQTGMGRTGKMFCCEHWGVAPDILCIGKAFGGGIAPIGAFVSTPEVWKEMIPDPFLHTSTFGGNPLACAAAIATIQVLLEDRLPERAAELGPYFLNGLSQIAMRHSAICLDARGKGLLLGIEFITDEIGFEVSKNLFDRGVLVAGTLINAKTVRIEPPLTIERNEIDYALEKIEEALCDVEAQQKKCVV